MKTVLGNLASLMMIAASAAIIWSVASKPTGDPPPPPQRAGYAVGDQISEVAGLDFAAQPKTLVIFLRPGCRYCTASMDFYRRLVARSSRIPIVVVSFDPEAKVREYLATHRLVPDRILSIQPGSLNVPSTPTLLLVESSRRVAGLWRGQLMDEEREAEVFGATSVER